MPITNATKAKTTSFINNCGLNSFIHVLIPKMDDVNIPVQAKNKLLVEIRTYYGQDLTWEALTKILREDIQSPIHREIFLGPVLRKLVDDQRLHTPIVNPDGTVRWPDLDDDDVRQVANMFGFKTDSFATWEALKLHYYNLFFNAQNQRIRNEVLAQYIVSKNLKEERDLDEAQRNEFNAVLQKRLSDESKAIQDVANQNSDASVKQLRDRSQNAEYYPLSIQPPLLNQVGVLDILNVGGHFEYAERDKNSKREHNAFYTGQYYGNYHYKNSEDQNIRDAIVTALRERRSVKTAFEQYELNNSQKKNSAKKQEGSLLSSLFGGEMGDLGPIAQIIDNGFKTMFGPEAQNDKLLKTVGNFFSVLFKFFFGIVSIGKQIGKVLNPGEALSPEELQEEGALSFDMYAKKLGKKNEGAAKVLYSEWRKAPNSNDVWLKMIRALEDNQLYGYSEQLLRDREHHANILLQEKREGELYQQIQEQLEHPTLKDTTEGYQKHNFETRFRMMEDCYHRAIPCITKEKQLKNDYEVLTTKMRETELRLNEIGNRLRQISDQLPALARAVGIRGKSFQETLNNIALNNRLNQLQGKPVLKQAYNEFCQIEKEFISTRQEMTRQEQALEQLGRQIRENRGLEGFGQNIQNLFGRDRGLQDQAFREEQIRKQKIEAEAKAKKDSEEAARQKAAAEKAAAEQAAADDAAAERAAAAKLKKENDERRRRRWGRVHS